MRAVAAIDPGKVSGWAVFVDGALHECGTLRTDSGSWTLPHDLWWCSQWNGRVAVVEKPVVYPHHRGGTRNPASIVDLAVLVGRFYEMLHRCGYVVSLVEPRSWKGTAPKDIHARRIVKKLSAEEREIMPSKKKTKKNPTGYDNNMLDAVGLCLWKLRRLVV